MDCTAANYNNRPVCVLSESMNIVLTIQFSIAYIFVPFEENVSFLALLWIVTIDFFGVCNIYSIMFIFYCVKYVLQILDLYSNIINIIFI